MFIPKSRIETLFWKVYIYLLSLSFVPNWLLGSSSKTFLDVGCGQGLPMRLIKLRYKNINSVGVDLFKPYIDFCKKKKIYDKYLLCDIRKLPFKNKTFDVVMSYQVIEHLTKKDALRLVKKMESLAKKIVIISTPVGKTSYHADDNHLQFHKSFFYPEEFEKIGYKTIRMGGKGLYDEKSGLFYKIKHPMFKKLVYVLDIFLTPYYLLFQSKADYYFFAYKRL